MTTGQEDSCGRTDKRGQDREDKTEIGSKDSTAKDKTSGAGQLGQDSWDRMAETDG
jgi:hypothetical protein